MASLGDAGNPRNKLLRDRLRQRCAHRAHQERTKRVERERRRNGLSSDGDDMGMESDEENDEELVLNDEACRAASCLCKSVSDTSTLPAVS